MLKSLDNISDWSSHINQEHDVIGICFLVLSAVISGAQSWADCYEFGTLKLMWLRKYRPFANGIPSQQNIGRIFRGVSKQSLLDALLSWVNEHRLSTGLSSIVIDWKVLKERFEACGLELHPTKTKIAYCKDGSRKGKHVNISFDFLGYTFRPRLCRNRQTQGIFVSFTPAVSRNAQKEMIKKIRMLGIRKLTDLSLE
jgi:hypothetical protein